MSLLKTKMRLDVRKNQNGHCAGFRCDRYLKRSEFHVDHIVPRCEGGTNNAENLQALCISCHMKKTKYENRKRMLGSIRLSKAEKLALGLKSAWIKSGATFEIKKQAFSYKKPIGKSYRI